MQLPDFLIDHPDGEIRLTGHRIGLYHVIFFHKLGYSAEMLHGQYPTLPLELIRGVIDFYQANQAEVDAYVAEYQAEIDRQRAAASNKGPSLSELRRKMLAAKQEEAK